MPDFNALPRDSVVEIFRDNTESSAAIDKDLDLEGAYSIIIQESVESPTFTAPDRDGPQFSGANTTDLDLDTFVADSGSGIQTKEGVFDFQTIANRDLFVKMSAVNTANGGGNMQVLTSDDDVSYDLRESLNAPDAKAFFEGIAFSGSFRYVKILLNSTSALGGVNGELYEVSVGALSQLELQQKNDAVGGSSYISLATLAELNGAVPGTPMVRRTYIGPDEVDENLGDSLATEVHIKLLLPSKAGQLKLVDPSTGNKRHAITIIKVYRN